MSAKWITPIVALTLCVVTAAAQEKPAESSKEKPAVEPNVIGSAPGRGPQVPLRVTVVISRLQGDKKISSLPYVLGVTANGNRTTLRMGINVPVAQSQPNLPANFSYRDVGTSIDCVARTDGSGVYQLNITVSDTSIHLDSQRASNTPGMVEDVPSFRNFNAGFTAMLREGQTTQYMSATDPVTGEVMKIDVTLNVMK